MILVIDASHPEQEKELEQFYMNFAQPYSLTVKQCLVVAVQAVKEGSYGLGGWQGKQQVLHAACGLLCGLRRHAFLSLAFPIQVFTSLKLV